MAHVENMSGLHETQGKNIEMEEKNEISLCALKEHERLDVLLSKIPLKAQTKLITCDLILTCIDANNTYIVLGSNIGLIFVFSREDNSIQKIKVTSSNEMISSVKLHEGTDHMVAASTSIGLFCVYCIPSKASQLEKKEIQKFEVKDVHKNYITCLEWSTNGMKLFSGDTKGHVVVTEVDFYEDKCTSMVLLIDAGNEIVQLSYGHKILAVSTVMKSYIVRLDLGGQITNIGTDSQKMPGKFGVCFVPGVCKTNDALLYIARQDCCLWLTDVKGELKNEHSFSFPFPLGVPEIFLHSLRKECLKTTDDFQFGKLKMFRDGELLTWYNTSLLIIDPSSNKLVAFQNRFHSIVDVAVVNSGEIFVLQRSVGGRIIRISDKPDPKLGIAYHSSLLSTIQPPTITKTEEKENPPDINSGISALSFLKKSLVNPLKKLDQHINYDSERILTSNNIPNAKIMSETEENHSESQPSSIAKTEDKSPENSSSHAAFSFLKKSLVDPLIERLDQHINNDTERIINSSNIPNAKILSESDTPVVNSMENNDKDRFVSYQSRRFNHLLIEDYGDEEQSIVVSQKSKKHKKHKKKGNHVATIMENKKDSCNVFEEEKVEEEIFGEGLDLEHLKEDDKSAIEALRRADSLLKKINLRTKPIMEGEQNATEVLNENIDSQAESSNLQIESTENGVIDIASELCQGKIDVESITSQSTTSEDDAVKGISDASVKLENKDSGNETSVEYKISDDVRESVEGGASYQSNESHFPLRKDLDMKSNSSSNSLSDCVERALGSLSIEDGTKSEDSKFEIEEWKEEVEKSKELEDIDSYKAVPAVPVSQNYAGSFDSLNVDDSSVEDLYMRSVYSTGSADAFDPQLPLPSPLSKERSVSMSDTCGVDYRFQDIAPESDINIWSELRTPTNIYSVSMSDSHVFYTDKTENIYHLAVKEKSESWKKASGKANQISVSPSGHIIWSLHKKVVYAGTKICAKHPEGLKWVEDVRNVNCISVDDTCAWYITQGGSVMAETKLCLEQPFNRPKKIACSYKLKFILCRYGVVWAITERLQLLVRLGVTSECPEGKEWKLQSRNEPPFMFNHVGIGHDKVGWAVDSLGQIWFCPHVSANNPMGCGKWWQVPQMDSLIHDESTRHLMKEVAQKFDPVKFSHIVSTSRGGLVTAGEAGIYLALDFNNIFNVCKGSIQGYQWMNAQPSTLPSTSAWKLLCANASHTKKGYVWAQHVNKELYALKQVRGYAKLIDNNLSFICLSANVFTVWGLTCDGKIMTRLGIDDFCPEGTGWRRLNLVQLCDVQIVHLSCSMMYVWAVDVEGIVYQRIGAKAETADELSPIWLPIDNFSQIIFTKIYAGYPEWMVWAIDNRRMIYTRKGVDDNLPIGREWVHVTGIQAMEMSVTRSGVWALTPSGEVYYRQYVTRKNICGKYWKKIPGLFTKISASEDDGLWGITMDGELRQCNVQQIYKTEYDLEYFSQDKVHSPSIKEDFEWEII